MVAPSIPWVAPCYSYRNNSAYPRRGLFWFLADTANSIREASSRGRSERIGQRWRFLQRGFRMRSHQCWTRGGACDRKNAVRGERTFRADPAIAKKPFRLLKSHRERDGLSQGMSMRSMPLFRRKDLPQRSPQIFGGNPLPITLQPWSCSLLLACGCRMN